MVMPDAGDREHWHFLSDPLPRENLSSRNRLNLPTSPQYYTSSSDNIILKHDESPYCSLEDNCGTHSSPSDTNITFIFLYKYNFKI